MKIEQHCKAIFSYSQAKPFKEILHDIFTFVGFITLCTYEQSYPIEIVFYDDRIKNEFVSKSLQREIPQAVKCIYQNSYYRPEYKIRKVHEHLVKYEKISECFSDIITSWFIQSKELEQVTQLLLRSFINKNDFSIEKFMDVVRAIENFHRQSHNNEVISKENVQLIKDKIDASDLSNEHKTLVKEKMNFAYEPSLKQRLEEMIGLYTFPYFDERVRDKDSFIKKAKDSRNYYTHFDKSLEKKSLEGKDLFDLTENLKLILFSAIFKRMAVPVDAYDESVRYLIYSS
jgi:ApeA N-terminal domain 1